LGGVGGWEKRRPGHRTQVVAAINQVTKARLYNN